MNPNTKNNLKMNTLKAILVIIMFTALTNAFSQKDPIPIWKKERWNLDQSKKEDIYLLGPTAIEELNNDSEVWKKPDNPDDSLILVKISPKLLGYPKSFTKNQFFKEVLNSGYTIPPKWLVAQLYLEERLKSPIYFATLPVRTKSGGYYYVIGKNPKGGTPTKKDHDLYLRSTDKFMNTDEWIFILKK